jgi:hypothetical protein
MHKHGRSPASREIAVLDSRESVADVILEPPGSPHLFSQPIVHTPSVNRTTNSSDPTPIKYVPTVWRHISSTTSGGSGAARRLCLYRGPPAFARGITCACERSKVNASIRTRIVSVARARSSDGFPSGWFERMSSRKRERASFGFVNDGSSPRAAYASPTVMSLPPECNVC